MLSSGSRDQLCSPPVVLLWSWVFAVLVYWGLVSLPCPLSLGQGQLAPCCQCVCDGLLIVFQFCSVVWLWMLLTGSGGELCGPWPALFQAVAYHWPAVSSSVFPAFVYWKFMQRSAPCPFLLLWCVYSTPPLLLYVSFQFLTYCLVFSFLFAGQGVILPRELCWFIPGVVGEYYMTLGAHLLVCQMSPKQVWSWHLMPWCYLFVTWHGEASYGLGVQDVEILILLGALFLPGVAPASHQDFWLTELMLSASAP
jgi:hypothetical protein